MSDSHDIISFLKRPSKKNFDKNSSFIFEIPDDLELFVFWDVGLLCDILIVV